MKNLFLAMGWLAMLCLPVSCKKDIIPTTPPTNPATVVNPVDIHEQGFEFLEKMDGHWVGTNKVMTYQFDWFALDYRAISPSHVFGIYEGGSMGNLLTSFFVTDFKNTRTIMARNGGVLNGIYRSSYFVLDSIGRGPGGDFYRLVDAVGGKAVMWMELRFKGDSLSFDAYTSGIGQRERPTRHMTFRAQKEHPQLAQTAANLVGFPQNEIAQDFSAGFVKEYLTQLPGDGKSYSATFLAQQATNDVYALAVASGDPFPINLHPHVASLQVDIGLNDSIRGKNLFLYLSMDPLTDANGQMLFAPFNTILQFPELNQGEDQFLFTYLHPGQYFVTVVADVNADGLPGPGDITHPSATIQIGAEEQAQISLQNIHFQN